jgi:hypothetical protein
LLSLRHLDIERPLSSHEPTTNRIDTGFSKFYGN